MKKTILLLLATLTISVYAQERRLVGTVLDAETKEPLIGVSVLEKGTTNGTVTDLDGNFVLPAKNANLTLSLTYVGYKELEIVAKRNDLGTLEMQPVTVSLQDVTVTGQIAVQRKTPIAVSSVTALEIEERISNTEFVEIFKNTPGVHANTNGGSWGDSEIYMRGFDNTNIAMLINGVPMNGMEDGKIYWSNWQGLADVASVVQTQRGLGASKLSSPSVGGTISIVTKNIDAKQGGAASYSIGNDGYNKVSFSVSTGLMKNGWAITVLGTKTWGKGYVQGTDFSGYTYFANISKRINDNHQLSLTGFGAPQWHYQRSGSGGALTLSEWMNVKQYMTGGTHFSRYNPTYGYDDYGNRKSANYNVYHKPQISLNHVWQIDYKSSLSTTLYASLGRGYGHTAENGYNSSYKYSDLTYGANYGTLSTTFRRADGSFDYGAVYTLNDPSNKIYDESDPAFISPYYGSQLVICQNTNSHNWYGLVSTYQNKFADLIDFTAGIDLRYYKGMHTAVISDMLGGSYYIDATRSSVSASNNSAALDPNWATEKLGIGDVCYRNYDGYVVQEGAFLQGEYNKGKWSAFLNASINMNHYWKIDHYYYDEEHSRSQTLFFLGGTVKAGANYAFNAHNNVFINAGYTSRAPKFDKGAFMSASTSNAINIDAKNEQVASVELGYGFHNEYVNIAVNGYFTEWMDKTMAKYSTLSDPAQTRYTLNMTGVNARHMGIEFELKARPTRWLELSAMLSIGDWKWDSDSVKGYIYSEQGQALTVDGEITTPGSPDHAWAMVNMKGIQVGGSAQTTANIGITFKPFKGLRFGAEYTLYDRNYAYYSFSGDNLQIGKTMNLQRPWRIPTGGSMDVRASYHFKVGKLDAVLSGSINNVLNQYYIEKAWNPTVLTQTVTEVNKDNVYFYFAQGRTWNVRLKINF